MRIFDACNPKENLLAGEFAVGKTSLIRRFVEGKFEDKYLSTIGTKISRKNLQLTHGAKTVDLTMLIWDLAGGEKFDHMMQNYYRGAAGAIIVCDLTRPETAEAVKKYATDFWNINQQAPLVIVANKIDLVEQRLISDTDLTAVADFCHAPYYVSSAKTGENVETVFQSLGQRLISPST